MPALMLISFLVSRFGQLNWWKLIHFFGRTSFVCVWIVSLQGELNASASTVEVADMQMDGRAMAVPPWIILHCCGTAGSGRSSHSTQS